MDKFRGKKLLMRYLVSFLLVLILPMALLGWHFTRSLDELLEQQSLDMKRGFLTKASSQLNALLDGLAENAYRLSNGSTVIRYKLSDSVRWGSDIIQELDSTRKIAVIPQDVFVYAPSMEYAYSSTSTYTRERFVRHFTGSTQDVEQFEAFLSTLPGQSPTRVYQNGYVDVYFSIPTYHSKSGIYLIYRLEPHTFEKLLMLDNAEDGYMYAIYKADHTLLTQMGGLDKDLEGEIQSWIGAQGGEEAYPISTTLSVKKQRYDIFIDHYPGFDWYYAYVSPQNEMVRTVLRTQQRNYPVIIAVMVLGGALCFVFTYLSYRPIDRLTSRVRPILSQYGEGYGDAGNELDLIQAALHSLQSSLKERISADALSAPALKQFFITGMLSGRAIDHVKVVHGLAQLGVPVESEFLTAAVVLLTGGAVTIRDGHLELAESANTEEFSVYAVRGGQHNQMDLLITSAHDDMRAFAPSFEGIQARFMQSFGLSATISVGKSYPEPQLLSASYIKAAQMIERRRLKNEGGILFAEDMEEEAMDAPGDDRFFPNVQRILSQFRGAVRDHNHELAAALLLQMSQSEDSGDLQVTEVQFLLAYVLEILASSFYASNYQVDAGFYSKYHLDVIRSITTLSQMRAFTGSLAQDIRQIMLSGPRLDGPQNEEGADTDLVARIRAYIGRNLQNSQLSISSIAREVGVSSSHLCRHFKEKTGTTVLECINDQRVEMAKSLLKETDLTLEHIVTQIGYSSASSFIRKFSRRFGVTPGKYREEHRRGK